MKCLATTLVILLFARQASAGLAASGDWSYQQLDATTYRYSLRLHDAGTTNIGTFWYAWQPTKNFLPTAPLAVVSPSNWSDVVTHAGAADGYAIEWTSSTAPLAPGATLTGFQFDSHDTPSQLAGYTPFYSKTPVGTSFVYSGAPFSDAGFQLIVPEPDGWTLAAAAALGLLALGLRRRSAGRAWLRDDAARPPGVAG